VLGSVQSNLVEKPNAGLFNNQTTH